MKQVAIVMAALLALVACVPAVSADHGDPAHGVVPRSIGDDPTNIHAVGISTPHPYTLGETYTYDVEVTDAESISVHFEDYDVNGYYSAWRDTCSGSEVVISDGNTDLELDRICAPPAEDFWTPEYDTDHVVITLVAEKGGWGSDYYGFDVYEVASDGAKPVATVNPSGNPALDTYSRGDATVDPEEPTASEVDSKVQATATAAGTEIQTTTIAFAGTLYDCSGWFGCDEIGHGAKVTQDVTVAAAGDSVGLSAGVTVVEDDETGAYDVHDAYVECTHGKDAC